MKTIPIICVFFLLTGCMKGIQVDQLFHNANIYTLDDANHTGEAMAIKNGKIVEIGPERQILNKYRADEVIDIEGKEIVPTFSEANIQLDSTKTWKNESLKEIEIQKLEQGITEVFVFEITPKLRKNLSEFSSQMELIWHISLTPSAENIRFIRTFKKHKNNKFQIQGFTITNENKTTIEELCSIAKNKKLQIGINYKIGKNNIPTILQSLKNYTLDHRWFAYNIDEKENLIFKKLEENNFFLCLNQTNTFTYPLYIFGSQNIHSLLLNDLNILCKNNKVDFINSLKSVTNWAQYFSFSESTKGTLSKGKNANFNIVESALVNRQNIYVNTTYLKGIKIYSME